MTRSWIQTTVLASVLGLTGCSSITVSQNAWTTCTLAGTAIVGGVAIASGMHVITGATLGLANAGLGCFLVFENATVRTEKKAALEREAQQAEVISAPQFDNTQPAMPIIPILPTIDDE